MELQFSSAKPETSQLASSLRTERWLATGVFSLPLIYLLTDHSWSPIFWHYSITLLITIGLYGMLLVLFLLSYHLSLPKYIVQARTLMVATGFAIIVAFIFLEAILTILDDKPNVKTKKLRGYAANADTGYTYIPNYEQQIVTLEATTHWRSNSLGIRADRDFGPKPKNTIRILALGDSFTVNTAVEADDTWPGKLEYALNQRKDHNTYEIINGGHAGYGTMQMSSWYDKFGQNLQPDVVLMAMTPNDIPDNGSKPPGAFTAVNGYLAYRNSGTEEQRIWEHRKRWYCFPGYLQRTHMWLRLSTLTVAKRRSPKLIACHEQLNENEIRLHKLTEHYILQLQNRVKARGASFGIILLAFREQLSEMANGYSPTLFGIRWSKFAREHDIPVIDIHSRLLNHSKEPPLFWRWDSHYTAEGCRIAAEAALELTSSILNLGMTGKTVKVPNLVQRPPPYR